ncbi:hypothetical protein D7Y13_04435 [Corallococcus praedator]|uniref:Uncharacterized protein n=1 Tax=Corallococcus praedator TaxID=2316724 RepID=A0ABX9QPS0_9BACT|nr:hypothetical protein D7X75_03270 [Corallococcus sp. CA031C]RKI15434.1 hypothetical protein D7Y13_04435 [Corallococcus praedator]
MGPFSHSGWDSTKPGQLQGGPSPPRTAPSPPAASAGTPTRAPPPAPPLPHLSRAHATVRLPWGSREPWETGELRPLAFKQIAPVGPHVPPVCPSSGVKNGTRRDKTGRSGGTIRCEIKALAGDSATCLGFLLPP